MIFVLNKCKQYFKNENHWSLDITHYSSLGIQTLLTRLEMNTPNIYVQILLAEISRPLLCCVAPSSQSFCLFSDLSKCLVLE